MSEPSSASGRRHSPARGPVRRVSGALLWVSLLVLASLSLPAFPSVRAEEPGGWNPTTPYPQSIFEGDCVTYSGAAYCVGGLGSGPLNATYWTALGPAGVGSWKATTPYPLAVFGTACAVVSSDLYCAGGRNDAYQNISATYFAPFVSGGGLGTWTAASAYPFAVFGLSCSTVGPDLFCLGSQSGPTSQTYVGAVSGATIRWSASTSYPVPVEGQACAGAKGFVYCVGSQMPPYDGVYSANLSSAGFSAWNNETGTDPYPFDPYDPSCVVSSDYLYCVGGGSSSVYFASVTGLTVGPWQTAIPYPASVTDPACLAASRDLYCITGGEYNNVTGNEVYYAPILSQSEGATTAWTPVTAYPLNMTMSSCVFLGSNLTCVGGLGGPSSTWEASVYSASASAGGLSSWKLEPSYPFPITQTSCAGAGDTLYCVGGTTTGGRVTNQSLYTSWSGGGLNGWKTTTPYPLPVSETDCVSGEGWLTCVGGQTRNSSALSQVYEAPLSSSGLDRWQAGPSYPLQVVGQSCAVIGSTVYCGGNTASTGGGYVFAAPLTPKGLGPWVNDSFSAGYPGSFADGTCLPSSVDLFCVGGASVDVYYAEVHGTSVDPWTETIPMPVALTWPGCASLGSSLYCVGGTPPATLTENGSYFAHAYTTELEVGCTPASLGGGNGSSTRCTATAVGSSPVGTVNWTSARPGTFSPPQCTLSGGSCSVTFQDDAPGNTTLTATFGGGPGNLPSYQEVGLTNRTSTSTEVQCPAPTLAENTSETCTGSVQGSPAPLSGETLFWEAGTGRGTLLLSSGTCTLYGSQCSVQVTGQQPGAVPLTARFDGNTTVAGSEGSANLTVLAPARSQDSLEGACDPVSTSVNGSSECTGQVLSAAGSLTGELLNWSVGPGTGAVTLNASSCRLGSYACSITVVATRPGTVSLHLEYAGDPNNLPANASVPFTIQAPGASPTTTTARCEESVLVEATGTSCAVNVTGATGTISGERVVWAQVGGNGTVGLPTGGDLSGTGCAVAVSGLRPGTVTLKVTYFGDVFNDASQGETNLTVIPATSHTTLTCSDSSPMTGSWVGCQVQVSDALSVTGAVNWTVAGPGGVGLVPANVSCTLVAATCSVGFVAAGPGRATLTATYEGYPGVPGSSGSLGLDILPSPGLERWSGLTLTVGQGGVDQGGGNLTGFSLSLAASPAMNGTTVGVVGLSLDVDPEGPPPAGVTQGLYYEVSVRDPNPGPALLCLPAPAAGTGATQVWFWSGRGWTGLGLGPAPANEVCGTLPVAELNQTVLVVGVAAPPSSGALPLEEIGTAAAVVLVGVLVLFVGRRRRRARKGAPGPSLTPGPSSGPMTSGEERLRSGGSPPGTP